MFDEIRTFVALAEAGSQERAAERLFLTPSAVTRQIQRLEAALGTPLLDRRVKPARLTRAGRAVLDGGRHVLRIMDDLKATASTDAEPTGVFRLGLSHALAQPSLVASIQHLTKRYRRLRPALNTDLTPRLVEQVRAGELDAALVFLPADGATPSDVASTFLAAERWVLVRARGSRPPKRRGRQSRGRDLDAPWVLNPPGCVIRHGLEVKLRALGLPFRVAAEIHNMEMQLSLVASGIGNGVAPARYLAAHPHRRQLERIVYPGIGLGASIVFIRAGHLGRLDTAATFLEKELREHFAERSPIRTL